MSILLLDDKRCEGLVSTTPKIQPETWISYNCSKASIRRLAFSPVEDYVLSVDNAGLYAKWRIPSTRPPQGQVRHSGTPSLQVSQQKSEKLKTEKGKIPCALHLANQTGQVWSSFGGTLEPIQQGYPPFHLLPSLRDFIPTCVQSYPANPSYVAMGTQCGLLVLFTRTKVWKLGQFAESISDVVWAGRSPEKTLLVVTTAKRVEFRNIWISKSKEKVKQTLVNQSETAITPSLLLLRAETNLREVAPKLTASPNRCLIGYLQSKFVLLWKWVLKDSQHHIFHHGFLSFLGNALSICFSADGKYLYLLTDRNVICVYDTAEPAEAESPWKVIHEYFFLKQASLVHDEILRTILMFRLHLRNFQPVALFPMEPGSSPVRAIATSRHHMAIGRKDGTVDLLDEPMLALEVKRLQLSLHSEIRHSPILKRTPIPRRKSIDKITEVPSY